ncbi:MAG: hypothetical protein WCI92_07970 [Bacteroidota bacterium]
MKKPLLLILLLSVFVLYQNSAIAQDEKEKNETKETKIPTGFKFAGLPTISFDADMGFQIGGLVNVFDYGDGSTYPEYKQSLKLEISRYTKGSGVNQLFYDSKSLLPHKIRFTADLSYLTEKGLDFYGFNGYQAKYNDAFVDENDPAYKTRMFYRHERKLFRLTTDLQGKLYGDHLRWVGGIALVSIKAAAIDTAAMNKKKDDAEKLPYTENLYDKYVKWGLLNEKERDGGNANFFKLGVVFDTRDKEASATKGIWSEALIVFSPGFFFNPEFSFTKIVLIHRQYFTIIPKKLTVAYRLGYQGTIGGTAPFYFEPYMISSFSSATKTDGLGGAKNLRGIMRNRVVGDGVGYGNLELRWKFLQTHAGKANLDFSLNGFADAGIVLKPFSIDETKIPENERDQYFDFSYSNDKIHPSAGAGLRIALNENFILAIDYGFATNKQDGLKGLYINVGNLF